MNIKSIIINEEVSVPDRGYSCITKNESLIITRKPRISLVRITRSINKAYSFDKHSSVELRTMRP